MFNVLSQINWLSILVSGLALSALGAAWFMGPVKTLYPVALGRTDLGDQKPSPLFIVGPLVCGLVVSVADAILLRALGITTYSDALTLGAITGAGYLVPQTVNIAINPNFPRPFLYSAINAPYFFAGNLVVCAILFAMS
jgi:Protein of unknown function (DUF1761)